MKTFVLEENFPCSVQRYFRIIYEKPDFKQKFHVDRGDLGNTLKRLKKNLSACDIDINFSFKDVEVSEWIEQGPPSNSHQRICFYSMVEKNTTNSSKKTRK